MHARPELWVLQVRIHAGKDHRHQFVPLGQKLDSSEVASVKDTRLRQPWSGNPFLLHSFTRVIKSPTCPVAEASSTTGGTKGPKNSQESPFQTSAGTSAPSASLFVGGRGCFFWKPSTSAMQFASLRQRRRPRFGPHRAGSGCLQCSRLGGAVHLAFPVPLIFEPGKATLG